MNDIDAEELKKPSLHVEMPVWADAKDLLEKLESRLNEKLADGEVLFKGDEWRQVCEKWKKDYPVVQPKHYEQKSPANVYAFIKEESRRLNEGQITVVGNAVQRNGHSVCERSHLL